MDNFLDKIFFRSRNLDYISQNLINLTTQTPAIRIFEALNTYSESSEVRYVGGCVRKIIKKDPSLAGPYYNRGIILKRNGRVEEAIDNYKKAISLKPDFKALGKLTRDGRFYVKIRYRFFDSHRT